MKLKVTGCHNCHFAHTSEEDIDPQYGWMGDFTCKLLNKTGNMGGGGPVEGCPLLSGGGKVEVEFVVEPLPELKSLSELLAMGENNP